MGSTTNYALPYPGDTDLAADGNEAIESLATAIDAKMATFEKGTIGARPASRPAGAYYLATDTLILYLSDGTAWIEVRRLSGDVPLGAMMQYSAGTDPADTRWLIADGRAISRTTYASLFALYGTTHGAGNGTTTFNIPDTRGRALLGVDGTAGRLTASDALGNSGGAEKVALVIPELPVHDHPDTFTVDNSAVFNTGQNSVQHAHNPSNFQNFVTSTGDVQTIQGVTGPAAPYLIPRIPSGIYDQTPGTAVNNVGHSHAVPAHSHGLTGAVSSVGSGTAHNNMQPYVIVNHIIRVL